MSFEPDTLQRLLLWRLAVSDEGGEFLTNVEANFGPAKRTPLVREGLIEESKRKSPKGRPATYLGLTEKGWAWCQNHLDGDLKSRSYFSGPILQRLLTLLGRYFTSQDHTVSFGQLVQQARSRRAAPASERQESNGHTADLEETICQACLEIGQGEENVRVRLADLRSRLADVPREALDDRLLEMERQDKLALYPLDNPLEIREEDRQAVLRTAAGNERHILYFGGRSS